MIPTCSGLKQLTIFIDQSVSCYQQRRCKLISSLQIVAICLWFRYKSSFDRLQAISNEMLTPCKKQTLMPPHKECTIQIYSPLLNICKWNSYSPRPLIKNAIVILICGVVQYGGQLNNTNKLERYPVYLEVQSKFVRKHTSSVCVSCVALKNSLPKTKVHQGLLEQRCPDIQQIFFILLSRQYTDCIKKKLYNQKTVFLKTFSE